MPPLLTAGDTKIARFQQRYNVAESGQFLQWGSIGKFFTRCGILMKFGTTVCLKPSKDRGEFELDRTRSKNNIAKNSFALGHEMHIKHLYHIKSCGLHMLCLVTQPLLSIWPRRCDS